MLQQYNILGLVGVISVMVRYIVVAWDGWEWTEILSEYNNTIQTQS